MICLLNQQAVLNEKLTWAHLRLAEVLKVSPSDITPRWEAVDGRYLPAFDMNPDDAEGVERDDIQACMKAVIGEMIALLNPALQDLRTRRE